MSMISRNAKRPAAAGFSMLEVLITLVIVAIGLLGLASLQLTSMSNQMESNQRAQAVLLVEDMANRIRSNANAARANDYTAATDYGRQDMEDCSLPTDIADVDTCQWNLALIGTGTTLGARNLGSVEGVRGCIEYIAGSIDGETIVRLTISWLGQAFTSVPASACGIDDFGEENEDYRRTTSLDVVLADLTP